MKCAVLPLLIVLALIQGCSLNPGTLTPDPVPVISNVNVNGKTQIGIDYYTGMTYYSFDVTWTTTPATLPGSERLDFIVLSWVDNGGSPNFYGVPAGTWNLQVTVYGNEPALTCAPMPLARSTITFSLP